MHSPTMLNLPNLRISLSSQWRYFYWGFLILALFNISLAGVNLMRPHCGSVLRPGAGRALPETRRNTPVSTACPPSAYYRQDHSHCDD
jgi:hypothetical protein